MLTRNDRLKTTYEYEAPECFLLQEEIQDRVNFSLMYSEIDTTNKNKDYITSSYVCANHGTHNGATAVAEGLMLFKGRML